MKVILAKTAGFCHGVENTVTKANRLLEDEENVYCLGEIVHNEYVIDKLSKKGMITIDNINDVPNDSYVIIRAHGEKIESYEIAQKKHLKIIDLTCGKVRAIHHIIEREKRNFFIVLIGKKTHPETIAHISYADNSFIIENEDDLEDFLQKAKDESIKKIYILAQTTFNSLLFDKIVDEIKKKCLDSKIVVNKTICNATRLRQEEVQSLAKKVNKIIIIGGRNSSNTKELYEVAKKLCKDTYLIQSVSDLLKIVFSSSDIVGLSAGASTPKEIIFEVEKYLNSLYKKE